MKTAIERIFGSRIRAKVLAWLFTHADQSFFVRQIASILKEDPTNLSREMAKLGNLKRYQANPACPFFLELKGLVLKTTGVAGQIKVVLAHLEGIDHAFIYGSYAKGEEGGSSDVDLLLIGNVDMDRLDMLLGDLEKKLGREINYVLYHPREFESKKKARDGFIMDVLAGDKIMLIGAGDGLWMA
jgi:predicted nucleotidyltransferase/predicted transcriptional regulator with HTH domain